MERHDRTVLVPGGYFDIQINGGWGHHFSDDPASIWSVGAHLLERGVTQFLPTLVSDGFEQLDVALDVLAEGPPTGWVGAEPIGWHLEGPWLNPQRAGAHRRSAIREIDLPDRLTRADGVRLVTLAPEVPGAGEAITELVRRGVVVSMGHSDATAVQAGAAIDAGAALGTHLFNAMSGLHHRSPGLAAALLDRSDVHVGLIADGHHVAPQMVRLAWRLAAGRIVLVSDAVSMLGTNDEPVARLADGTIAGATMSLDQCVQNVVAFTRAELADAVAAASSVPRALFGVDAPTDVTVEVDATGSVQSVRSRRRPA